MSRTLSRASLLSIHMALAVSAMAFGPPPGAIGVPYGRNPFAYPGNRPHRPAPRTPVTDADFVALERAQTKRQRKAELRVRNARRAREGRERAARRWL